MTDFTVLNIGRQVFWYEFDIRAGFATRHSTYRAPGSSLVSGHVLSIGFNPPGPRSSTMGGIPAAFLLLILRDDTTLPVTRHADEVLWTAP